MYTKVEWAGWGKYLAENKQTEHRGEIRVHFICDWADRDGLL